MLTQFIVMVANEIVTRAYLQGEFKVKFTNCVVIVAFDLIIDDIHELMQH